MKRKLAQFRIKPAKAVAILALLSMPATLYAITDYFLEIYNGGSIGYNYVGSSSSSTGYLLVGSYNQLASSSVGKVLAVGEYNMVYDSGSTVLGTFNKDTGGNELLVLGRGTSSTKRNAMAVFKDGKIAIQPQGDIGMGIYGHPGDTGMGIYRD